MKNNTYKNLDEKQVQAILIDELMKIDRQNKIRFNSKKELMVMPLRCICKLEKK